MGAGIVRLAVFKSIDPSPTTVCILACLALIPMSGIPSVWVVGAQGMRVGCWDMAFANGDRAGGDGAASGTRILRLLGGTEATRRTISATDTCLAVAGMRSQTDALQSGPCGS